MPTTLITPALHVHRFTTQADRAPSDAALEALRTLGMTEVVAPDAGTVRAFQTPGPGIVEAVWQGEGGLAVLSVCLAPEAAMWSAVTEQWRSTRLSGTEALLEAQILYALYDGSGPDSADVNAALPPEWGRIRPQWADLGDGIRVYEATATSEDLRRVVLLAPVPREVAADAWLWPDNDTRLRPIPRYFAEIAKVRHRMRVLHSTDLSRDRAWFTEHADTLLGDPDTPMAAAFVREAHRHTDALALTIATLTETRIGLRAARANIHRLILTAAPTAGDLGPFRSDLDGIEADMREIDDQHSLLTAAGGRADALTRMADRQLDHQVSQALARNSFAVVVQAAMIGAVLVALAVIQSIGYTWPLAEFLRLPMIAAATAVAFLLPLATAGVERRRSPWHRLAEASVAATVGWLTATTAFALWWSRPAPVAITLPTVAALTVATALWWLLGSRRASQ